MVTAVPVAQPAPWERVPAKDQLFVLVTGANSGIGLGTAQRLIDEFLATRSLTSHLILIPTTRSATKSRDTIRTLRAYTVAAAQNPKPTLLSRAGGEDSYRWQDTVDRIHILSLTLDLCDLRGLYAFADALCRGTVSNPDGLEGEYLKNVRVPRLDSVICNAGFGGWSGINWGGLIISFFKKGFFELATYPDFKISLPTCILNERSSYNYGPDLDAGPLGTLAPEKPLLGEVFTACTFGHYCLSHQLRPLLSRTQDSGLAPGRIVWTSSVEAHRNTFDLDDIQCFTRPPAYESVKRLTDIISLTSTLPSVKPISNAILGSGSRPRSLHSDSETDVDDDSDNDNTAVKTLRVPPRMYLVHPGVAASTLMPLPGFLFWAYQLALMVCRLLGSPWHTEDGYRGAYAPTWITMEEQSTLDALGAERIKWGSASERNGSALAKETEVEGWGWHGEVENPADDKRRGAANKGRGRRVGAKLVTKDDLAEFEEQGVECWREMERLRLQWEGIIAE